MPEFLQDVRYSLRAMRKSPGFTVAAVLTLALGIGATAAIFSVVRAVLLSPLPYALPESRVMVWSKWKDFDKTWVSDGELADYQRLIPSFRSAAAWSSGDANLTGGGAEAVRVGTAFITANTFEVLGANPVLGRGFTAEEDRDGGPPVAVLSYGIWQNRFGGDSDVLGQTIEVDGVARRVVGVMPRGFALPTDFTVDAASPSQLWLPAQLDPASTDHGNHGYYAAARLKPGATAEKATAELKAHAATLTRQGTYPETMRFEAFAVPVEQEIRGPARQALTLVFGAVAFLLLMACANVANLLLARSEGRAREISVRAAIGAGRGRLMRQLLTESFVLSLAGALVGIVLAWGSVRLIAAKGAAGLPAMAPLQVDRGILLFAIGLSILTTFLFGLAPALKTLRLNLVESLRDGAGTASAGVARVSLRGALAALQMGMAALLLLGAGLMIKSLDALMRIDLGFEPKGVLTMQMRPPAATYEQPEHVVAFYRSLLEQVRGLPGVESAGVVRSLPLGSEIGDWGVDVDGFVESPGNNAKGDWQIVSDGAIEALGERIVRGRSLAASDTAQSEPVVLINQTFEKLYFSGREALGGRVRMGSNREDRPWMTVVGIVRDERHNGMTGAIKEKFYVPHSQFALQTGFTSRNMTLLVRTKAAPMSLAGPIKAEVKRLDPAMPVANVRPMTDVVDASIATPRLTGSLLTIFAALALALAAIGVSGVLAYLVSRRRREIGIRMALGASRANVIGLIVRRGAATAAVGIVAGVIAAFFLTRLMQGLLYGVAPRDFGTFAGVSLLLLVIALVASAVPAFRAARVNPLEAFRSE
jgi:predicted permease